MIAIALVSFSPVIVDRVDKIELNHVYNHTGDVILSQLIFWDWNCQDSRFYVRDWRMYKTGMRPIRRRWMTYVVSFSDNDGKYRRIYAPQFCETWTYYDPEVLDRSYLPAEQRQKLGSK